MTAFKLAHSDGAARQAADISHGRLADIQESLQDAEMEVNDLELTLEDMDVVDSAKERTPWRGNPPSRESTNNSPRRRRARSCKSK